MRGIQAIYLTGTIVTALAMTGSVGAQPMAHNTPDQIVCKISGSCGNNAPADQDKQIKVGDERAFSLARPDAIKSAAPAVGATAVAKPHVVTHAPARHEVAVAPPTSSGGLDMLVGFDNGSAELTPQAKAEARAFAEAMRSPALAGMRFSIDGHTDAVGNREYNLDLSKRRAQSVADYLVTQGIDVTRLDPHGYGFDKPRPGTAPRSPSNRRVEFAKLS